MSSTTFKNLIQRREHKERSQPAHRSKYGLLEKHSDYVERAKNFHGKEKRILALKRRASMRNPDEYYFGMHSTKTKNGVHTKARDTPVLTDEELQLLKTQDRSYVQTIINTETKRIDKLEASLHGVSAAGRSAHGSASSHHLRFDGRADGVALATADADDGAGVEATIDACLDNTRAGIAVSGISSGMISGLKRRRAAQMGQRVTETAAGPARASKRSRTAEDEREVDDEGGEHEHVDADAAEDSDDALSVEVGGDAEDGGSAVAAAAVEASGSSASHGAAAACRAGAGATIRPAPHTIRKATAALYGELQERRNRLSKLQRVLAAMALEAQLRSKGAHKKVQEATSSAPAVYKWKPVRSR